MTSPSWANLPKPPPGTASTNRAPDQVAIGDYVLIEGAYWKVLDLRQHRIGRVLILRGPTIYHMKSAMPVARKIARQLRR